jgi:hypothetical protein
MARIVFAYLLVMSLAYNYASPPFENPDELDHARYAAFVAETHRSPQLLRDCIRLAFHPPLHHAFVAPIVALSSTTYDGMFRGYHLDRSGHCTFALGHGFTDEAFPYSGVPRFVHLARLVSLGGALIGLLYCWKLAGILLPPRQRIVALVGFATLPQLQYLSASINHDTFGVAAGAALAYYSAGLTTRGGGRGDALRAGLALAAGLLTKSSFVVLLVIPIVSLVVAASTGPRRRWSEHLQQLAYIVLPALVLSGWWYARMWMEFGSITPAAQLVRSTWVGFGLRRDGPFHAIDYYQLLDQTFRSFVFVAGAMSIDAPRWVYWLWTPLVGAAVLGTLRLALRREAVGMFAGLAGLAVGLVVYNWSVSAPQGRYLFPVLAVIMVAVPLGFEEIFRSRAEAVARAYVALLAVASVVAAVSFQRVCTAPPPQIRELIGTTARLFCDNLYSQVIRSAGGTIQGFRIFGRASGGFAHELTYDVRIGDGGAIVRRGIIPGDQLQTDIGEIRVLFGDVLRAAPGDMLEFEFASKSSDPIVKPSLLYDADRTEAPFRVNGVPQEGMLRIEELVAD